MPLRFHPLYVVLAVAGVVLALALLGPVRRAVARMGWAERGELAVVATLGVAARALAAPWGMAPVPDMLWSRLSTAWGLSEPHVIYGAGIGVLGGIARKLTDAGPDAWVLLQVLAACLTPPLVWSAARALGGRPAALTAGLAMAALPAHVLVSASVMEHVTLTAFTTGAVAAALAARRQPSHVLGLLAGLLGGIAPHIRPEVLALTPLVGALLARAGGARVGRLLGLAALVGLVGWRVATLGGHDTARSVLTVTPMGPLAVAWDLLVGSTVGRTPASKALNVLAWVPLGAAWFWPLALVGATRIRRSWPAVAWWVLLFAPVCLRGEPLSDAIRFQLPSLPAALVLAGLAVERLPRPRLVQLAPWGLAAATALFLPAVSEPWAPTLAFRELRAGLVDLPPNATPTTPEIDRYARSHAELIGLLSDRVGRRRPAPLAPHDPLPDGEVWLWWPMLCTPLGPREEWIPSFDAAACDRFAACELEPVHEAWVRGRIDSIWTIPPEGVRVGWYRVRRCPPPSPPAPGRGDGPPRGPRSR